MDSSLPPMVFKKILKLREKARYIRVVFGEHELYEVLTDNQSSNVVSLRSK